VSDLSTFVGIAVLIVSLAVGGFALFLLRGDARPGAILSALVQVTLIPERRRRFLLLLWVATVFFLITGVLLGLYHLGWQLSSDPDLWFTATFLAGVLALGGVAWVGLSPRTLSESERATAEKDAPTILESLWMVPYRGLDETPTKRRRP
jgi:hypothetical protein